MVNVIGKLWRDEGIENLRGRFRRFRRRGPLPQPSKKIHVERDVESLQVGARGLVGVIYSSDDALQTKVGKQAI
jgi:hypothetical protein